MITKLWALLRSLFIKTAVQGVINLPSINTTTDASADVAASASTGAVVVAAADVSTAAATTVDTAAVADAAVSEADAAAPVAVAAAESTATAAVVTDAAAAAAAPVAVATVVAAAADPVAAALVPDTSDDEDEDGESLENVKAITGDGVELFATIFKEAMTLALSLGHEFEDVFETVKARAQALAAKL